ncbi:uncharacterized protein LOC102708624 [Oryza brachyantha]|uniref:uncharacterized protein LOC102708624 n=1 Tax=Oryza brachyantha TaxID=4533 RepID=UPI001ADC68A7|nr:uncharacterized protein LOC102708624 [Oryza brachyantha]
MQKSQGPTTTARRRPLRVLSGNRTPHPPPGSRPRKPAPAAACPPATPAPAACPPSVATSDGASLDRLLLARSDLSGLVSQIDELVCSALQCQTVSERGNQEIEAFGCFLSDTNSSLKHWSSRLKQVLQQASPEKSKNVSKFTSVTCPVSATKGNSKLLCGNNSNLDEADLIVSPSPLVSWRAGACMVDSGKQLFLLTPLPKTKTCSSRCPKSSTTQLKTTTSLDQLNLPNIPVLKLTISDDNCFDLEKSGKGNEAKTGVVTPCFIKGKKGSSENSLFSPFSFSVQKSGRALPSPCLRTALSSKQQRFSPISEGSRKEDILGTGPTQSSKPSEASDDMLSDEISKDLASRYPDLYAFNQPITTYRRREADDALDWFLSPLKTCVLMDPSDEKPIAPPAGDSKSFIDTPSKGLEIGEFQTTKELSDDNPIQTPSLYSKALFGTPWKGLQSDNPKKGQGISDGKPHQTPAVHSRVLLGTPWKGLESTNLKGRQAGETTLKRELWTRFEAVSTNELHFDSSIFQRSDGRRFIDILEEEAS